MMAAGELLRAAVGLAIGGPALLLALFSLAAILSRPLSEKAVARLTSSVMIACVGSLAVALGTYLVAVRRPEIWTARTWFSSAAGAFRFDFLVDGWSLAFALLAATISAVTAAFSYRYLHREPGFARYFTLFASFVVGILFIALAGSIEVLFAGWELLGLSSTLLVGFFHERRAPVQNAFRVFAVYRVSDAAMLIAAVLIHHAVGSGSLFGLFQDGGAKTILSSGQATIIAIFILIAVAGKSALLPFSGWLPRAMEGPTPSSAVYYGALSVHAGCYLLWRSAPLLEQSVVAQVLTGVVGAMTAIYASLVGRVQTDVKSSLSFAALNQVGIIICEIALGFYTLAFVHMAGHASVRLLQFLAAPNVMEDLHELDKKLARSGRTAGAAPAGETAAKQRLYLFALERGFLDAVLDRRVIAPFRRFTLALSSVDRFLAGETRRAIEKEHPRK